MKHPATMLLDLIAGFLALFPERGIAALAAGLGALWWHVLRYRRAVILENLAQAFPDATPRERRRLGRRATTHLVRTLLEVFRIPHYERLGFEGRVEVEGIEHFEAARRAGKGVLCLSGHLGSFELAVAAIARRVGPVHLVVKPFPAAVDAFLTRVRTGSGLGLIPARSAIRGVLDVLEDRGTVVFVLDQNATRSAGVFVDFFGRPASTFSALAAIAARRKTPVIAAVPYRREDGIHVLRVLPAIPLEEMATREETIRHMTQAYTRVIEDAIRAHPEQWFWTHKRWRTRPAPKPEERSERSG